MFIYHLVFKFVQMDFYVDHNLKDIRHNDVSPPYNTFKCLLTLGIIMLTIISIKHFKTLINQDKTISP